MTPALKAELTEAQLAEIRRAQASLRAAAPALAAWGVAYCQAWADAMKAVVPMMSAHLKAADENAPTTKPVKRLVKSA